MRVRMLKYVEDDEEPTVPGLSKYSANEEPTVQMPMTRSDALFEAHEILRSSNNCEAAGVWMLVAEGL